MLLSHIQCGHPGGNFPISFSHQNPLCNLCVSDWVPVQLNLNLCVVPNVIDLSTQISLSAL